MKGTRPLNNDEIRRVSACFAAGYFSIDVYTQLKILCTEKGAAAKNGRT